MLPFILDFVRNNILENVSSGRRDGGQGGVPAIIVILTDNLDTDLSERTRLKKSAVELKKAGASRIFGVGVKDAHDWDKRSIRKTWKSIVSR